MRLLVHWVWFWRSKAKQWFRLLVSFVVECVAKEKAKKYLGSDYIISGIVRDGVPHIQLLPPIPQHTHTSRLSFAIRCSSWGVQNTKIIVYIVVYLGKWCWVVRGNNQRFVSWKCGLVWYWMKRSWLIRVYFDVCVYVLVLVVHSRLLCFFTIEYWFW